MTRHLVVAVLLLPLVGCTATPHRSAPAALSPQLTSGVLTSPWMISSDGAGFSWITERAGRKVIRLNPSDGDNGPVVDVPQVVGAVRNELLGLAFAPGFLQRRGTDFVYLAYDADGGSRTDRRVEIVRYTYRPDLAKLVDRVELTGDPYCLPVRAQVLPVVSGGAGRDWSSYVDRLLRLDPDDGVPGRILSSPYRPEAGDAAVRPACLPLTVVSGLPTDLPPDTGDLRALSYVSQAPPRASR
jgi:hypothetical protein